MGWNSNLLTKPVGLGDVSVATGVGPVSGTNYDLGYMIANGSWNLMAKYKPVCSSNPGELSVSDRAGVIFGFTRPTTFSPGSAGALVMPTDWTYNKPTGGQPNQWFRALDFDGYDVNAISPIAVDIYGDLVINGMTTIRLWKDGGVNNYWANKPNVPQMPWQSNQSMSVQDFLDSGGGSIYDKYVAFVFYDTTSGSTAVNWVTTRTKIADITDIGVFLFYANGNGSDNPEIPILQSTSRNGHSFTVAACLCSTPASGTKNYEVVSYSLYSMAWDTSKRTDRQTITARSTNAVDYLSGTISTPITLTKDTSYSSSTWDKYIIGLPIYGSVSADTGWSSGSSVNLVTSVQVGGGVMGDPSGSSASASATITKSVTVNTGSAQTKTLVASGDLQAVYFVKQSSVKTVSISTEFSNSGGTKSFSNTVVLTAS